MNILVVDDDSVSRSVMEKIMGNFGTCEAAESGRAALAAFVKARNRIAV